METAQSSQLGREAPKGLQISGSGLGIMETSLSDIYQPTQVSNNRENGTGDPRITLIEANWHGRCENYERASCRISKPL